MRRRRGSAVKRIAIFCDGTWNSPRHGHESNVLHLARGLEAQHEGFKQVAFYDWGVGTDRKRLRGGLSGAGIDKNILDCYRFLVHNYHPGDTLYFFGFSRGAYTARSLAGFIRNCGLLMPQHAAQIPAAYALYRKRSAASHPDAPEARAFRAAHAWSDLTPIRFMGVWDTVGALGIPVPFWGVLGQKEFLFHDTAPSRIIEHARHALAIDECRQDFEPTLWDRKPGLDLQQVWFAGVHSNVGGSYADRGLSDLPLQWIAREAALEGLGFTDHALARMAPNHAGQLYDSRRGIYRARAARRRQIQGPIHHSVRQRWEEDIKSYRRRCAPLRELLQRVDNDWQAVELAF